jgi:glycosyltransferase involved in cell wall biosynthesis
MLSILIPTYHYHTLPLVEELVQQCELCAIPFEIIVQDDAPNSTCATTNNAINKIAHCSYHINRVNLGRGANINSMSEKAQYPWLLILDCDTFPTTNNFIKNYIAFIKEEKGTIAFGGIAYKEEVPQKEAMLRWVYGQKREALPLAIRKQHPNQNALTSNLLIAKDIFIKTLFTTTITQYGYEDLVLLYELEQQNNIVTHLDNNCYHLNLETSEAFIAKTKLALENLKKLHHEHPEMVKHSKIVRLYSLVQRWYLLPLLRFSFGLTHKSTLSNLRSAKPSLHLFDWYKIGYFSSIQ